MTDLKDAFEKAVAESKQLPSKPDNETLLSLYSLYKQATEGDINAQNTRVCLILLPKQNMTPG